jgi:hypothetical protein
VLVDFLASTLRGLRATPRWLAIALVLCWATLTFELSAQSPEHLGVTREAWRAWAMNLCHAPEYGATMLFLLMALRSPARGPWLVADVRAFRLALALLLAFAVSDEIHQAFTPGRDASVCDILTDACGASFVAACVATIERGRDGSALARILAIGLPACAIAALIATFLPASFPGAPWL